MRAIGHKIGRLMFLFSLLTISAQAQQRWPFEYWHEGKVVLVGGDTLNGMVKYDLQQDLLQYSFKDNTPDAYTARKVLFFEIFDETASHYRRFFSLPYATTPGYKSMIFFELLEEGKLTLLAREYLEYKTSSSMYFNYSRQVLSYKYFFLKDDGEIDEFLGSKNDLLDMMGKKSEQVEKYIRQNRLHFEYKEDLTRIIEYYNSLF